MRSRYLPLFVPIVLVVSLLAACDDAADDSAEATAAPTATVEAATTTTAAMTDEVIATDLEWFRVRTGDDAFTDSAMRAVTVGGPGLVAVGTRFAEDHGVAAVWTSPDGLAWSRVPLDEDVLADSEMRGVTVSGLDLVAVGSEGIAEDAVAAVWTSPDGLTWSRVAADETVFPKGSFMSAVAAGGPGLVAVGSEGPFGETTAAVWTSPDGLTWSRVAADEAVLPSGSSMTSVAAGGPGLVAVGSDGPAGGTVAAVWTSPDGLAWSRVPHDEAIFTSGWAGAVGAGDSGLVAVGFEGRPGEGVAAMWTSPDGLAWSRVPHDEAIFGGDGVVTSRGVIAAGSGAVAIGTEADALAGAIPVVWTSPDRTIWARVPHDEATFGLTPRDDGETAGTLLGIEIGGTLQMDDVTVGGPGVVIVGSEVHIDSSGQPAFVAAAWYAPTHDS